MQTDTLIVLGLFAILSSFFPLLNAMTRGEFPRVWAVLMIAGFAVVTAIIGNNPNTYSLAGLPEVVMRVVNGAL